MMGHEGWLLGTHGHVIPLPYDTRAGCPGPPACTVCRHERALVTLAASGQRNAFDACGGPGVCPTCRHALAATGIPLNLYRGLDGIEVRQP